MFKLALQYGKLKLSITVTAELVALLLLLLQ